VGFLPIPPLPNFEPELPPEVQSEIDASVLRFEQRWIDSGVIIHNMAKQQGWIADYRREVTELVKKARAL
jgi:hypothetical protein